jgi:hypothetical protein
MGCSRGSSSGAALALAIAGVSAAAWLPPNIAPVLPVGLGSDGVFCVWVCSGSGRGNGGAVGRDFDRGGNGHGTEGHDEADERGGELHREDVCEAERLEGLIVLVCFIF